MKEKLTFEKKHGSTGTNGRKTVALQSDVHERIVYVSSKTGCTIFKAVNELLTYALDNFTVED